MNSKCGKWEPLLICKSIFYAIVFPQEISKRFHAGYKYWSKLSKKSGRLSTFAKICFTPVEAEAGEQTRTSAWPNTDSQNTVDTPEAISTGRRGFRRLGNVSKSTQMNVIPAISWSACRIALLAREIQEGWKLAILYG